MSSLAAVGLPELDNFSAQITPPATVELVGVIAIPDPGRALGTFFAALHRSVTSDGLPEVSVDVRHLTFVNSSAIRLFVDWATWVKNERGQRYTLRFITSRNVTWQKTSFTALMSLMKEVLAIEQVT